VNDDAFRILMTQIQAMISLFPKKSLTQFRSRCSFGWHEEFFSIFCRDHPLTETDPALTRTLYFLNILTN
jgi:hypothetical protein